MPHYEVCNRESSHSFGLYAAQSPEGAIEACCRDAGYTGLADAEEVMGRPSQLVAYEVDGEQTMPTRSEIASDWALWQQYVDPYGTMDRAEFDALTDEQKVTLQADAFGPEVDPSN